MIEELAREECLRLLQEESYVGRLGFIVDGRPMILPVNYLARGDGIVFCTGEGTKLSALRGGAEVAFEIDASRPLYGTGWSVVARGTAREVTDQAEVDLLRRGPLVSWASPSPEHWIRIEIEEISGRRIPQS